MPENGRWDLTQRLKFQGHLPNYEITALNNDYINLEFFLASLI
jgi:hypothetical protein